MQQVEVLRALLAAQGALKAAGVRAARRAALPPNVGAPWTEEEFVKLLEGRRAGDPDRRAGGASRPHGSGDPGPVLS